MRSLLPLLLLTGCGSMMVTPDAGSGGGTALVGGGSAGGGFVAAGGAASAGGSAAGGSAGGAAFPVCANSYAGCSTFDDRTNDATVSIDFSTAFGSPKCLRVRASQTISVTGISSFHPFRQSCGPDQKITSTSAPTTLTSLAIGLYGFYCPNHSGPEGTGMGLAVQVVQ